MNPLSTLQDKLTIKPYQQHETEVDIGIGTVKVGPMQSGRRFKNITRQDQSGQLNNQLFKNKVKN
jgi:hypothetical protein